MKDLNWLFDIPQTIVAEVKDKSPFGFKNPYSRLKQLEICEKYGDIISIHTDSRWGGSLEWLKTARQLTTKPILAKGFHSEWKDIDNILDMGIDYVLTVDQWDIRLTEVIEEFKQKVWFEYTNFKELDLKKCNSLGLTLVWNKRNPRNGEYKIETIDDIRKTYKGKLCQASHITKPEDIGNVDYILIGEGLYL